MELLEMGAQRAVDVLWLIGPGRRLSAPRSGLGLAAVDWIEWHCLRIEADGSLPIPS
jgi:hypothetical protein